jgi:two-component system chemotaxis response regulator CheY
MILDDLNTMTRIVDSMLRKCGFTNTDQVHDAATALQMLRNQSYLFVISDREMPGMTGVDFVREVRADSKISFVPIIMMSASSSSKLAEEAIAAGANAFLTKPFTINALRDVFVQQLRRPS